ncbi:MAG: hypothetical protein KIY12_05360 [Thermoplasmata archaeon]|uniref:Uncharacterized protein n=1 Tax=Candidatus Sysuiplasma superficiale TaxID=2823368 RepID=A0A8J8CBI1_9ARCH|nr:hypothetical protein [Candidatus Sysuiplasma superficiale]MBX8644136.1 hypothetical protein [Candidatus Sysuiplasma superficiale]MCL4346305.1 hypothetical protein [Candidatus Thermoplasmatota archaeon]MCL5437107.1 hypothetical protein [Candidatus Thermoplasmatota archaeon]
MIYIVSDDFRFSYDVSKIFRSLDVPYLHFLTERDVPPGRGVIVKKGRSQIIMDGDRFTLYGGAEETARRAWLIQNGLVDWNSVAYVGVDPGARPGVAIYSSGKRIVATSAPSPEAVSQFTRVISSILGKEKVVVRIGHGDPTNRDRTVRSVWSTCAYVEMVDESKTSRMAGSDGEAAALIGRTPGTRVKDKPVVSPSEGEIREIQRRSRLRSDGETTISRSYARAVAKGKLTIEEAIRAQRAADRKI